MCERELFVLVAVATCGVNVTPVGRENLLSCVGFAKDFKSASSCLVSIVALVTVRDLACRTVVGWVDVAPPAACICDEVTRLLLECTGHAGCGVFLYLSSSLRKIICGLTLLFVLLSLFVMLSGI